MMQRKFQYQDDKSNKFWHITLEDCSHTVNYGRIGNSGRTQSKSFDTEIAAKKSYEKLIQQKQKKGYIEIESENNQPTKDNNPNVQAIAKSTLEMNSSVSLIENKSDVEVIEKDEEQQNSEQQNIPKKLEITRSIDLKPEDWHWATWLPRKPLLKSKVKTFNLEKAQKQLEKVAKLISHGDQTNFILLNDWKKAKIDKFISQEEARFWLTAISSDVAQFERHQYQEFIEEVSAKYIESSIISIDDTISQLIDYDCYYMIHDMIPTNIASVIYALFPFIDFISALTQRILKDDNAGRALGLLGILVNGFEEHIWHYLDDTEIDSMRQQLGQILNPEITDITQVLHCLAAYLGMHEQVSSFVENSSSFSFRHDENAIKYIMLVGLSSSAQVEFQMRRLKFVPYYDPIHIRFCLATTEYATLDLIRNSILEAYNKETATKLLKAFSLVKAPEAAPYMLELWLSSKDPNTARQWLHDNPINSIIGLIPVAAGQLPVPSVKVKVTEMSRAAIYYLISLKRNGYEDLIRQAIELEPEEIANIIQAEILENEELNHEVLTEKNTPQWLKQRIAEIKRSQKSYKLFSWVTAVDLPVLIINKKGFNKQQINTCLIALSQSTLDSPHPLLKDIKNNCDRASIDNFVWSLFERWLIEGAPKKENWAMLALGLLGGDEIAIKFTPYIRKWPGESQHHRAVLGLQCLRTIGSDTALMQINGIARKIKYKGLKARAQECIQAIARDRNLSPDELEDRIIPSLGLDEKGQRVFDYGDRKFHFVLGQDLKPMVRDEQGKLKANPPKPAKKDNAELATQALVDWKLLKKQIRETIKIQIVRLEQAMTNQRRWQWQEFADLLANHPFMIHLVQRIIWAGYDADDNLVNTFRLAEDRTYADAEDEEISTQGLATVGIIHPIHLTSKQRSAWGETLSDYEIIPPFPQINREVYTITPEEADTLEITRFKDITIPGVTLLRTMESLGWLKGSSYDSGNFPVNYKYFPEANITAIVGDYECQHVVQDAIWGDDAIDGCLFFPGQAPKPYDYPLPGSRYNDKYFKGKHLKLKDVDDLVMSEVLRDLYIVTSKARN